MPHQATQRDLPYPYVVWTDIFSPPSGLSPAVHKGMPPAPAALCSYSLELLALTQHILLPSVFLILPTFDF